MRLTTLPKYPNYRARTYMQDLQPPAICPHRDLSIAEHCPEQAEHAAALMVPRTYGANDIWPDGGHLPAGQITWSDERPKPSQPVPDYECGTQEREPAAPSRFPRMAGCWLLNTICALAVLELLAQFAGVGSVVTGPWAPGWTVLIGAGVAWLVGALG